MRTLVGVAAAVAAMTAWCLVFLVPLYLILGPEAALSGDGTRFSTIWVGLALVVCLGAATLGGWLVHRLSGRIGAVAMLTTLVAVAGVADATFNQYQLTHTAITIAMPEAFRLMLLVPEPSWYDWMLPPLMAAFVWVMGSSRALESTTATAAPRRKFRDPTTG